ncbi:multifunctional oxoglutarate decarboxylase/oxoglutarate dehydrogenase thiamine pyrophosphate-binding subunit/dihydrolipoyllysine-residue succinyltransferase subunit [Thermoleophilia bacterium SCSIO 60948]|nr:multifunctional oxoglutarate decarboxylase/oxoglutarate dehydrogenase thiamine pyrophosphate-binding subunit/dihydrolipoyllysine-residue succinyltransferase subunit [Thermoleophilia bacterium SCSIO 60948]
MTETGVVDVEMPAMGESVTEGTVLEWHKSEGDHVEEGETIVEVSTDKVDAEVPAPASGTLTEILAGPDDVVEVGQTLARVDPNGDAAAASAPSGGTSAESNGATGQTDETGGSGGGEEAGGSLVMGGGEGDADIGEDAAPSETSQPGADEDRLAGGVSPDGGSDAPEGETVELTMPEMGESVTEGTVLEWIVAEGDHVEEGDTVIEVSTDKVDAEVPAPVSGVVSEHLVAADDVVSVGQALARITAGAGAGSSAAPTPSADEAEAAQAPAASAPTTVDESVRISPVARRIAEAGGVDVSAISGSGPGGRITKSDVLAAGDGAAEPSANGASAAAPVGETKPLRGPAAMLAQAMADSREVPTATSFRTLAVDTLDAKRKALNEVLKEQGAKLSFTHLIAWAIVRAIDDEWTSMARTFSEADGKPQVTEPAAINLGIAVDIQRRGQRSLMVPCIRDAGSLDFKGFHSRYEELITKTRENALTADDFRGTNVTLTNPGGIGTVASVPRLLSGQGTIVATGSIAYPVEWSHATPEKIKALGISKVMTMTSTYDHRIIQGAESGSFLRSVDLLLSGEEGFYESVAQAFGVDPGPITHAHPASASAPALATGSSQPTTGVVSSEPDVELLQGVQAATSLLKAYRTHGHLAAHLDPLGHEPKGDPALVPESLDLTPELMSRIPASILRIGVEGETLLEVLPRLREAYCGTIGYQIEHLSSHQQRMWLREMIETGAHRTPLDAEHRRGLLTRLIDVFQFERFLQKSYLGQKTFSIEGLDVTVPMIDTVCTLARRNGAEEVVLGMAHRGRLSVLAHNLGRSTESILAEFEGAKALEQVKSIVHMPHGGTGDVKYHQGAEGMFSTQDGEDVKVLLYPNPSHLEFVDPAATGGARAAQTEHSGPKLHHNPQVAVPLLLHGDAAFPGQGVVAETLNLQSLNGYSTGGTIHIIMDNQVGFTTEPSEGRSTPYASDLAKGFNVPIIHVNADDVEGCISAVRMAMAYRERWGRDVVIDLIGYRRYGHNETDEPAYTQPLQAAKIKAHQPVSEIYAEKLVKEGVVSPDDVSETASERQESLRGTLTELRRKMESGEFEADTQTGIQTGEIRQQTPEVETKVSAKRLRSLNAELIRVPDSFTIHRKLRKPLEGRIETLESGPIEFGHAEGLAFASLLTEGTHVRLTGQDAERGTFSHRHLALHDEKTGLEYMPIQNLSGALAPFELHNSPLSETACLGFEYGYSAASPESLIIWEAQFGDFINGAQVIVDQFIVSGEAKWGQTTRLTLLLPHGYEGAGPEHSSARMERFLALAAERNIRLANPTTAGQYFHLLRRQARIAEARPLVVFTPKGLLRLKAAASTLEELSEGSFQFVLDDPRAEERREKVERLVLCQGKVYYDIDGSEQREAAENVAVARVEMLYPFPRPQLTELIERYPNLREVVWVQEEPENMGAWKVMARRVPPILPEGVELRYVGRPQRASPSEGYPVAHRIEQERIVLTALTG